MLIDGKNKVINIIKELKTISEIDESIDLIESEFFDSFDIINLVSKIEEEFKIQINGEEIIPENLNTINHIIDLITRIRNEPESNNFTK